MKITKIRIKNFKSIKNIDIDVKKHGGSYTTMFLGVNESGKSNLLEAISFLSLPLEQQFKFNDIYNPKGEKGKEYVLLIFHLAFENTSLYLDPIRKK